MDQIKIGRFIAERRKMKDFTQSQLAEKLGITDRAVSKWETETTLPDVTMLPAIASFFDISIDELLNFNLYETKKRIKEILEY